MATTAAAIIRRRLGWASAVALVALGAVGVTAAPPTGSRSTPGSAPSRERMPVGNLPGWRQVFADDFKSVRPRAWGAYPAGWHDTSGRGTYDARKVISTRNGVMTLHLHTERGVHLVAAPYPRIPGATASNGQLYGRYAVRFRADPVPGYKTAWLLWPDSENWPRDGEIDFPDGNLDGQMCAFLHGQDGTTGGDQEPFCVDATYTSWHTAVVEWLPSRVTFILDGKRIGMSTTRIPSTPMHWVLQTETALDGPGPSDRAAGDVQIDWVAVYRPESRR